jgi:hypothetical protein
MRTWPRLFVFLFVSVCNASPPTYDEAVKLSENIARSESAKEWAEGVFAPFSNQHMRASLQACVETLNEGETAARFVVDVREAPKSVVVHDDTPTPFSSCLKGKLQALEWPKAPEEIQYLPVHINAHRPKDGPQNADDLIKSITPSNSSPPPDPRVELLALHEEVMRAHRESNADLLLRSDAAEYVSANRGQITQPTIEERRERLRQYLGKTRFTEYIDLVAPVVRVSNDGSLGWVIVQVRGAGAQTTQDGDSQPLAFESAWIELYERRGGRWYRVGNASNFKP